MLNVIKPYSTKNRAAFSRLLLGLSMSVGFGFATLVQAESLWAQHCEPGCGCETNRAKPGFSSKPTCSTCKPACGPSFAEKFLKKLDEAGDRFEASRRKVKSGKCEACFQQSEVRNFAPKHRVATPSCGCESCATETMPTFDPYVNTRPSTPAASEVIGDQRLKTPRQELSKSNNQETAKSSQEPAVVRSPFEPRIPTSPQAVSQNPPPLLKRSDMQKPVSRIPVEDSDLSSKVLGASPPSIDNTVQPPFKSVEPTKIPLTTPVVPNLPALPDVLVDPFKDDPSVFHNAPEPESIQLTSARRVKSNGLRLRAPNVTEGKDLDAPEILTPSQRKALGAENGKAPGAEVKQEINPVVPIAYHETVPVRVTVRSKAPATDDGDQPRVGRIAVPRQR